MAAKLPPEAEEIRRKYSRLLDEKVVEPTREELEERRRNVLKSLHSLEESADPLQAADRRMMELGLQKQLNRIDWADRGLEDFRKQFQGLGAAGEDDPEDPDPEPEGK